MIRFIQDISTHIASWFNELYHFPQRLVKLILFAGYDATQDGFLVILRESIEKFSCNELVFVEYTIFFS